MEARAGFIKTPGVRIIHSVLRLTNLLGLIGVAEVIDWTDIIDAMD